MYDKFLYKCTTMYKCRNNSNIFVEPSTHDEVCDSCSFALKMFLLALIAIFSFCHFVEGEYIVTTYTGNVKDSSTNAKVYIKFTGANGDSKEVELSKTGSVPFQQGG